MISLRRTLTVFTVILAIGVLFGCQNSLVEPPTNLENETTTQVRYIKASAHALGLAKGEISTTVTVDADEGATLGGSSMEGNAVEIPADALEEDMTLQFKLEVTDEGILQFAVKRTDGEDGGHIYFRNGKTSTLLVNEEWLAEEPNLAVNLESGDQFPATQAGDMFKADLPHFSTYIWSIAD